MKKGLSKLSEYFDIKHGYAFKGEYFSDEGSYVLLTPGNFYEQGGFKPRGDKEKYYIGDIPESYILNQGDLIVVMTEQMEGLLGSPAIVPADDKYLHNQRLGLVVDLDNKNLCKKYLYYLFNTDLVRHQISASATGTKVRHTSPKRILSVEVSLPDISIQRKIASILSHYDDLVENNTCRIKLLEQSAQELYKEWFVRLKFPGHEHTEIIDGVPEGWSKINIGEVCYLRNERVNPLDIEQGTPYVGLEHIPRSR
ncbi:MAG: restriction endonuclease subunit S [Caldilineaceae bacterium]